MSSGETIESKEELKRNMCETTCMCEQCGAIINGMEQRCKGHKFALKECNCDDYEKIDCDVMAESVDCSTHCTCKKCMPQLKKLEQIGMTIQIPTKDGEDIGNYEDVVGREIDIDSVTPL